MVGAALAARDHVFARRPRSHAFPRKLADPSRRPLHGHPRAVAPPSTSGGASPTSRARSRTDTHPGPDQARHRRVPRGRGPRRGRVPGRGRVAGAGDRRRRHVRELRLLGRAEPVHEVGNRRADILAIFGSVAVAEPTTRRSHGWLRGLAACLAWAPVPRPPTWSRDYRVRALVANILLIDDLEDQHFDASKGSALRCRSASVPWQAGWRTASFRCSRTSRRGLWIFGGYGACGIASTRDATLALGILPVVMTHEDEPTLEPMTAKAAMTHIRRVARGRHRSRQDRFAGGAPRCLSAHGKPSSGLP